MRKAWFLAVAISIVGCGDPLPNDSDDVDLAAARADLGCVANSEQPACELLADFAGAGPVTDHPTEGVRHYLGESLCAREFPTRTLKVITLFPEQGRLGVQQMHITTTPSDFSVAIDRTLVSLREGRSNPGLEGLPEEAWSQVTDVVPSTWAEWTRGSGSSTPTLQSSGSSLLLHPGTVPAWWDDAELSSALSFARQTPDGRLLIVTPSVGTSTDSSATCVLEARPLP